MLAIESTGSSHLFCHACCVAFMMAAGSVSLLQCGTASSGTGPISFTAYAECPAYFSIAQRP
eukprot:5207568-Pyramimonas_sp.AAC.1